MISTLAQAETSKTIELDGSLTLCADGSNTLCSIVPVDLKNINLGIGYIPNTNSGTNLPQTYLDYFGWQAFVALNWPTDSNGKPSTTQSILTDVALPRVWANYKTKEALYKNQSQLTSVNTRKSDERLSEICGATPNKPVLHRTSKATLHLDNFTEAFTPYPLIDQQGNFVLYDVRINDVDAEYILKNKLNTLIGQKSFKGKYNFPAGEGNKVGAIELKTSWRILNDEKDLNDYFSMDASIAVSAKYTESGKDMCIDAKVGLVGMHIMQKVTNPSNIAQFWVWASFEHKANAPLADDAVVSALNASAVPTLTPPSCKRTKVPTDKNHYSFYSNSCTDGGADCKENSPPSMATGDKTFKWANSPPYAKKYLQDGQYGTQVIRCFDIYDSASTISEQYNKALVGSVWNNYTLIGVQWAEASNTGSGPLTKLKPFAAPVFMTNTTLETYVQTGSLLPNKSGTGFAPGSCITCHNLATDVTGKASNFSFLPGDIKK